MNAGDRAIDWFVDNFMSYILIGLFVGAIVMMGALVYGSIISADEPHIALDKRDWRCAKTAMRTYTTMMLVGKIMVPQVHTNTVCIEYRRVGGGDGP